ncbi:MAG: YceD family protein, partial [Pseudomonadales bacterium]
CLEPVSLTIAVDVDVVLSAQASVIEQLDFDQDSLLLEGEHISVAELIEDQLLLALPMSPKHWECRGLASETDAEMDRDAPSSKLNEREGDIAEGRQRPFADLKAITKKID